MNPKVLLVCTDKTSAYDLHQEWHLYFDVCFGDSSQRADALLRALPDLVLAADTLVLSDGHGWNDFAMGCELSAVRCILFAHPDAVEVQLPGWC